MLNGVLEIKDKWILIRKKIDCYRSQQMGGEGGTLPLSPAAKRSKYLVTRRYVGWMIGILPKRLRTRSRSCLRTLSWMPAAMAQ